MNCGGEVTSDKGQVTSAGTEENPGVACLRPSEFSHRSNPLTRSARSTGGPIKFFAYSACSAFINSLGHQKTRPVHNEFWCSRIPRARSGTTLVQDSGA